MAQKAQKAAGSAEDTQHALKLSIDILSVKDLKMAANLMCGYTIKLSSGAHSFRTETPTPVAQATEARIEKGFASY